MASAVQMPLNPDAVPMGANLVPGGATFRCWAQHAKKVYISGEFNGWQQTPATELFRRGDHWLGYVAGARDGHEYKFWVVGDGTEGYKRDPYARELTGNYPFSNCVVRDPDAYPWRVRDFRPPPFNDLIIYQLHVGVWNGPTRESRTAKLLDVLGKLRHLVDLGINAIQLLPIVEFASPRSLGYEGFDIFSPEMDYAVDSAELPGYLPLVNGLLQARGLAPLTQSDLTSHTSQLKAFVDVCHAWGVAVLLDVVYNHAGGQMKGQDESIWFFDRCQGTDPDSSQFFTRQDHTGPVWAIWKQEVRQFQIDNAVFFVREYRIDGFRYDQTSVIVSENQRDGWRFCQDLTSTVRCTNPSAIQIAEYWNPDPWVVRGASDGGAGFDACWHDGLRRSIRDAVEAASHGGNRPVDMERIAANLWPPDFPDAGRAVQYIESHDEVRDGKGLRIPKSAHYTDPRSWYATSRSRVAAGLLLTAPGIPMLFMGQEIFEDKQWSDDPGWHPGSLIWWDAVDYGKSPEACEFERCLAALTWLRRSQPALRGDRLRVIHARNDNRVLVFHRWLEGEGRDLVVVASLNDQPFPAYEVGFPGARRWREIFNSGFTWGGNGDGIDAWDASRDDMPATARLTIPANSILVFAR
jgi:1,4-alpha-glucan branching enzyme